LVSRPLLLFLLALCFQYAYQLPTPPDWDSAYYGAVARHIAAGKGAVSGALWSLLWLPESLPMPADLYWMPLPSRLYAVGLFFHPLGDRAVAALVSALLAPLAWWLGGKGEVGVLAGLIAASGGMYGRYLASTDSVGPYALLGALGLLCVEKGFLKGAMLVAALAALTRNEGFLWGLALALGFGWRGVWVAGSGLLCWAAWQLRCWSMVPEWGSVRVALAGALTMEEVISGNVGVHGLGERVGFWLESAPKTAWLLGLLVLPFPAIVGLVRGEGAWGKVGRAYGLCVPVVGYVLMPAVFAEGAFFRSGAALFVAGCVWFAREVFGLAARQSRYHRYFVVGLLTVGVVGFGLLVGPWKKREPVFEKSDCEEFEVLPPGPVFSRHPPMVEAVCGRISVMLPEDREEEERLRERFVIVGP
jgi:hypothetical protein